MFLKFWNTCELQCKHTICYEHIQVTIKYAQFQQTVSSVLKYSVHVDNNDEINVKLITVMCITVCG